MEENTTLLGRGLRLGLAAGIVPLAWSGMAPAHWAITFNLLAAALVMVASTGWCPLVGLWSRQANPSLPGSVPTRA